MAGSYELVFDVLGYEAEVDGQTQRCEIEGRGRVFAEADLHPACLARGLEIGALVPAGSRPAPPVEPDAAEAAPVRRRRSRRG